MYAKPEGGVPVARVLQGPMKGPLTGTGSGQYGRAIGAGLPHFRENTFTGEYPFGRVDLSDPGFPLDISVETFNPFIPLNDFDLGLPASIFLVHVRNPKRKKVSAVLYTNLENRVGHPNVGQNINTPRRGTAVSGIMMTSRKHAANSPRYGSMALATTKKKVKILSHWPRLKWFDNLTWFWDRVSKGKLPEDADASPSLDDETDIGTIAIRMSLDPGEAITVPVIISWHFPNNDSSWCDCKDGECDKPVWKNYYATKFGDAWEVAEYIGKELARLEERSRAFHKAFFESTYPASVIDAVGSQISILKTTTCLRLEDGTFWGWEGCCDDCGCCAGTCSHVWNYTQAMPYLFPQLERSARNADYEYGLRKDGSMRFRQSLPLGNDIGENMPPAADGQMGNVIRFYRDWKICGDDEWLRKMWPGVKKSLEFAWKHWDADKDGVMEGVQHNTYDIEFYGPNTMMGTLYLAALRAAEEIARYLGEDDKAEEYHAVYASGRKLMDKRLFNGEWYEQKIMPSAHAAGRLAFDSENIPKAGEMPKYQYGKGCLSDQMIGQWYAYMLGLGDLLDEGSVKKTIRSIYRYNFRKDLYSHPNPQRVYAQDGDSGTLLCSWPRGGRPEFPFPYSDEVWTGIEYEVAALLMYAGFLDRGLAVVKAARDRHDGTKRNPWDEYECGHHYARAMSSYSILLALSGFQYSAPENRMVFAPKLNAKKFRTFFSVGSAWGTYSQEINAKSFRSRIAIQEGRLKLKSLGIGEAISPRKVTSIQVEAGERRVAAEIEPSGSGALILFEKPVLVDGNSALVINIRLK